MNHLRKLGFRRLLANTFEVAQFAEWSPRERCDIDMQSGAWPENWGQFEPIKSRRI
jgi:hypothetical protein